MNQDGPFCRLVRVCWPLFGGAWVAWLVVQRLLEMRWNGDSFGSLAYLMFGIFLSIIVFIVGAAIAALLGRLVEWLMRRIGAAVAAAVTLATLVNVLAIWQIGELLQATSPALRATIAEKPTPGFARRAPPQADRDSRRATCRDPRPLKAGEAATWDAECR
jgi:NhaP-type Na+/H+ or K+/H+ antiporter